MLKKVFPVIRLGSKNISFPLEVCSHIVTNAEGVASPGCYAIILRKYSSENIVSFNRPYNLPLFQKKSLPVKGFQIGLQSGPFNIESCYNMVNITGEVAPPPPPTPHTPTLGSPSLPDPSIPGIMIVGSPSRY